MTEIESAHGIGATQRQGWETDSQYAYRIAYRYACARLGFPGERNAETHAIARSFGEWAALRNSHLPVEALFASWRGTFTRSTLVGRIAPALGRRPSLHR